MAVIITPVTVCGILPAFEKDGPLTAEEMEQRAIAKSKMLGNIKFIGRFCLYFVLDIAVQRQCR